MEKPSASANIQDSFLGKASKERAWLTVFLNNGKKITGRIRSFDRYTMILEDRGGEQMIFKHAIATISITRAFSNTIGMRDPAQKKSAGPRVHEGDTGSRSQGGGDPGEGAGSPDQTPPS